MQLNRGLLFWGLALLIAGGTALAVQLGYLDRDTVTGGWRLWPLILVAIGLSVILSRTPLAPLGTVAAAAVVGIAAGALISVGPISGGCSGAEPGSAGGSRQDRSGSFGAKADVVLRFDCGRLQVRSVSGDQWNVSSERAGGGAAQIDATAGRLAVTSNNDGQWWTNGRQRWEVNLPAGTAYQLEIQPNAADATIDLAGGQFDRVSLQPNAGSVRLDLRRAQVDLFDLSLNAGSAAIQLGSDAAMSGTLSVNAGSIELCTEPGVTLRLVMNESVAFSNNLEGSDLVRSGDTWSTSGYADAANQVELRVTGNAGSFTLNPEGGCS